MSNAAPVPTLIFEETSNRGPTPFHPLNFSPAEYLRPHKTTATVTKNIIIISPILLSSPCSTPIVLNVNPTAYQPTKTSQQASLMEETHSNLSYLSSNDNHIAVVPNAHLILRIAAASIADTVPPVRKAAAARCERGVVSVEGSKSPGISGLSAAGTRSIPIRVSILRIYGP